MKLWQRKWKLAHSLLETISGLQLGSILSLPSRIYNEVLIVQILSFNTPFRQRRDSSPMRSRIASVCLLQSPPTRHKGGLESTLNSGFEGFSASGCFGFSA